MRMTPWQCRTLQMHWREYRKIVADSSCSLKALPLPSQVHYSFFRLSLFFFTCFVVPPDTDHCSLVREPHCFRTRPKSFSFRFAVMFFCFFCRLRELPRFARSEKLWWLEGCWVNMCSCQIEYALSMNTRHWQKRIALDIFRLSRWWIYTMINGRQYFNTNLWISRKIVQRQLYKQQHISSLLKNTNITFIGLNVRWVWKLNVRKTRSWKFTECSRGGC